MAKGITGNKTGENLDDFEKEFKRIGIRLKQLRRAAGFTSAEKFSNEYGFDRRTYQQWEGGKPMSIHSAIRLAMAHKISLSELFKGI